MSEFRVSLEGAGVTLDDAIRESRYQAFLEQPDNLIDAITSLAVPAEAKAKLEKYRISRPLYHMLKLMAPGRSNEENRFGLTFLDHFDSLYNDLSKESKDAAIRVSAVISSEGMSTRMWWTVGPYLQSALVQNGIQEQEAFKRVLMWADHGQELVDIKQEGVVLPGLQIFNDLSEATGANYTYVLSTNPQGPSHILTKHIAGQLAQFI